MPATQVLGSSLHGVDDELGTIVMERDDDLEDRPRLSKPGRS
jgi:hypothetical protein